MDSLEMMVRRAKMNESCEQRVVVLEAEKVLLLDRIDKLLDLLNELRSEKRSEANRSQPRRSA